MSTPPIEHLDAPPIPEAMATSVRVPTTRRLRLRVLPAYAPLIRALATRDLKARYKQSALGPAWVVFQPIALLAAFSVGFRSVAHVHTDGVPYVLFALAGLAIWTYFQAVTMASVGSVVNNYSLVRWTACPRLTLPLATLLSNLPSFIIPALAAIIAAAASGYLWVGALFVPVLCIWLLVLVAACAIFLAGISVRARDVISVVPFLLQVTMFLAPVAYSTSQLPPWLRTLIEFNPLTGLIEAWRWSLLDVAPSVSAIVIALAITLASIVFAWRFFGRLEVRMADEI